MQHRKVRVFVATLIYIFPFIRGATEVIVTTTAATKETTMYTVNEPSQSENCTDPNAEFRYDDEMCVATCAKPYIVASENSGYCFGKGQLKPDCYCKLGYMYDPVAKSCVLPSGCSCDRKGHEVMRFSNGCANDCATYRTGTLCSHEESSGCWCEYNYCKTENGTCISKKTYDSMYYKF